MAEVGGQPGNNNPAKAKIWSEALRKEIVQGDNLAKLAKAAIAKALEGDIGALREIGDRLEGKVKQQIDLDASLTVKDVEDPVLIARKVAYLLALEAQSEKLIEADTLTLPIS